MNTATLPFDEIKGQKLSNEQRSYLEGLFAGLANRGFKFTDVAPNPAALPSAPAVPSLESLIFEERIKREDDFRVAKLPVLYCSPTMELGIDIGTVDLVVQISSPRAIAVALQRLSRTEHEGGMSPRAGRAAQTSTRSAPDARLHAPNMNTDLG